MISKQLILVGCMLGVYVAVIMATDPTSTMATTTGTTMNNETGSASNTTNQSVGTASHTVAAFSLVAASALLGLLL